MVSAGVEPRGRAEPEPRPFGRPGAGEKGDGGGDEAQDPRG